MPSKTTARKKRGRKPTEITAALCRKVEKLAAGGRTEKEIAESIGIGYSTLQKKKTEFKEFIGAIKKGQAKAISAVENSLFLEATDGNTTAMIFFLKNRNPEFWKDRHEVEHSGEVGLADCLKKARERVLKSASKSD